MRPSGPDSAAATDLQDKPAIGPFFQHYYDRHLKIDAEGWRSWSLADLPAQIRDQLSPTTMQRLWAQTRAHWHRPAITHYAVNELRLLEDRLRRYELGLRAQLGIDSKHLLRTVKQVLTCAMGLEGVTDAAPGNLLDLTRIDFASSQLEFLARALRKELNSQTAPLNFQGLNRATTTWLASLPQLLRQQIYQSSAAPTRRAAMHADLAGVLSSLPMRVLSKMVPQGSYNDAVCFPVLEPLHGCWQIIYGAVEWDGRLIIVDADFEADYAFMGCETFENYLACLLAVLTRPMPCTQFRRYLDSAPEVSLYRSENNNYQECSRLRRGDYQQIIYLAVSMNDMLAQMRRLQSCLSRSESHPVMSLSIHELMCYQERLREPRALLYFLEERMRALSNPHLGWLSELDHLCIQQSNSRYADLLNDPTQMRRHIQHRQRPEIEHQFQRRLQDELSAELATSSIHDNDSAGRGLGN